MLTRGSNLVFCIGPAFLLSIIQTLPTLDMVELKVQFSDLNRNDVEGDDFIITLPCHINDQVH